MDDQRPSKADALAHAARELARIRRLEAVEADQVDGGQRAAADLRLGQTERLQPELHVLEHGQPGEQREALEDHGDPGSRPGHRLAEIG